MIDESYSLEAIEMTHFHTKAEREQKEVNVHLEKLNPCMENAFFNPLD